VSPLLMTEFASESVVNAADFTSVIVFDCGTGTVTDEFGAVTVPPAGFFAVDDAVFRIEPASTSAWVTT
jgi:hypothetical protein